MATDASDVGRPPSSEPLGDEQQLDTGDMSEFKSDREQSEDESPTKSQEGNETAAKKNAKDPSRPRRKKARRACFACQRAHLTCGDERPCLRCIKRGLQDHCHDGVRKKAKYLHDAPNEALAPGLGGSYHHTIPATTEHSRNVSHTPTMAQPSTYFPNQISPSEISSFHNGPLTGPSQSPGGHGVVMDPFANHPGNMQTANFTPTQNIAPMQPPSTTMDRTPTQPPPQQQAQQPQQQQYSAPFIDPTDPSFFNFDISSLNFGNQYGALEFGMLGHMASGAGDTPDDSSLISSINTGAANPFDTSTSPNAYSNTGQDYTYGYQYPKNVNQPPRHNSANQLFGGSLADANGNFPGAFAIGEGTASISSTSPGIDFAGYGSSPVSNGNMFSQRMPQHEQLARQAQHQRAVYPTSDSLPQDTTTTATSAASRKRKRDPSHIYDSVRAPYSYTTGFHSLTAFIQSRFSPQKTLRIAKALASIRPSFIACTKELNRDDLIFMEKCFQRTLLQYDDFLSAYGCPTLIFRRTGEVAAVSKEFSLLTGWRRDVLLGKEANLNVNNGGTSGSSSRGAVTPLTRSASDNNNPTGSGASTAGAGANGRPQPVFLAELLDDDSVIGFYEDFAKLAFGDSRGYVVKPCKLLRYKTKDDVGWGKAGRERGNSLTNNNINNGKNGNANDAQTERGRVENGGVAGSSVGATTTNTAVASNGGGVSGTTALPRGGGANRLFSGEAGMNALGDKDGKVNCMFCWAVKRDVFDIPMMVVMNFLPCI